MNKLIEFILRLFRKKTKPQSPMREMLFKAGNFFSMSKMQSYVKLFRTAVLERKNIGDAFLESNGTDYRRAELFGKDLLLKLLADKNGKEVVALRFYYGLAPEDADGNIAEKGTLKPRLFIVPVDENGKDIQFDTTGLKSEPNGDGGGDGITCPRQCA